MEWGAGKLDLKCSETCWKKGWRFFPGDFVRFLMGQLGVDDDSFGEGWPPGLRRCQLIYV